MPKLPGVTSKRFIKFLVKLGFVKFRSRGSYQMFVHKDGRKVIVPVHGRDIPKGTLHGMLKDIQISVDEALKML